MRRYEEPQLKCAMFSSESISAAAGASDTVTPKTNLNEWLENNNVAGDVAVVKWTEMGN